MKSIIVTSQRQGHDFRGEPFFDYEFSNGFTARAGRSGLHVSGTKGGIIPPTSKNYRAIERAVLTYQFQYGV